MNHYDDDVLVSIPFIAGQWSLHVGGRRLVGCRFRFNPLHCGAVVASDLRVYRYRDRQMFQSPSLRGSGRFRRAPRTARPLRRWFQSPSLRGSGRFRRARAPAALTFIRFNPLHCGAVVASQKEELPWNGNGQSFNPLHCGAVVAS